MNHEKLGGELIKFQQKVKEIDEQKWINKIQQSSPGEQKGRSK